MDPNSTSVNGVTGQSKDGKTTHVTIICSRGNIGYGLDVNPQPVRDVLGESSQIRRMLHCEELVKRDPEKQYVTAEPSLNSHSGHMRKV